MAKKVLMATKNPMATKFSSETKGPMATKFKWQQKFQHQLSCNCNESSNTERSKCNYHDFGFKCNIGLFYTMFSKKYFLNGNHIWAVWPTLFLRVEKL